MESSIKLRKTGAAIAAAALSEAFPGCELLGGGETSTGFFYQFFCSYPIPPEAPRILEEKMRQMIREDREIHEMEMVAQSAREMFMKQGHLAAVGLLEEMEPKELVSIIKLGMFCELAEGPFCSSLREIGAFQIRSIAAIGDSEYRLEGHAFPTKDQLKNFQRLLSNYEEGNHLAIGERLHLWQREGMDLLWHSRGVAVRQRLIECLQQTWQGRRVAGSDRAIARYGLEHPYPLFLIRENRGELGEDSGLLDEGCQSQVQQKIYCLEKDLQLHAISLLQSIEKTLIILGFQAALCLKGRRPNEKSVKLLGQVFGVEAPFEKGEGASRLEWIVADGLGRLQSVFACSVEQIQGTDRTLLQIEAGVERILSLLLEMKSGFIPNWLIPEHLRILPVTEKCNDYASRLQREIEGNRFRVTVDRREKITLKEKLSEAMREGILFVGVVGERELQANTVAVRRLNADHPETMSWEQLIDRLNENQ